MADPSFPSWWGPPEGPPVRYLNEATVPKGAVHFPGDYNVQTGQWEMPDPLDHDGDGKKGGSAPDSLKAKRALYENVIGKKPFMGWDEAKLDAKIAEATAG